MAPNLAATALELRRLLAEWQAARAAFDARWAELRVTDPYGPAMFATTRREQAARARLERAAREALPRMLAAIEAASALSDVACENFPMPCDGCDYCRLRAALGQEEPDQVPSESPMDVHGWFGLTYASYLVVSRTLLQSMPPGWQARFTALFEELAEATEDVPQAHGYHVQAVDERGKFVRDPVPHYDRGRTVVPLRKAST